MKSEKAKKIATWIIVPLMVSFFLLDMLTVVLGNKFASAYMPTKETFISVEGQDRIHFINTANSDCILLESNGHFALIDSGEGNNNPRRKNDYQGYEETVVDYLNNNCADENGVVHLDFILGTHYHYDHVGSFYTIINTDFISIEKAYFKPYDESMDKDYEYQRWGLSEEYEKIMNALEENSVELIRNIPETIEFYDFNLELFNTVNNPTLCGKGENSTSVGIKVTKGDKSAFLAADITKTSGVEDLLINKIGHCDLLKVGHHGYFGSSSIKFLDEITPQIAIVTNSQGKVYPNVKWNLTMHAKVPFFGTYDYNGIIADFSESEIVLTCDIQ